jgi:sulfate transport system ATP-binding protein
MSIRAVGIHKRFGDFTALDGVDLDVQPGELVALLGPSGSGKTTLLRILAGLERPDAGRVYLDGADATDRPVQERRVGFVFQQYALFRHMTVFENIAFGLRVRPRRERLEPGFVAARVRKLLDLVQLDWVADRFPHQLSGGQRQRIALARALAIEPRVLLLDEPFGALDARVRKDLRRWLRQLHEEVHVSTLFVTHDQDEALELADRVVLFNEGRIEQAGTPAAVYEAPASAFVHRFLGNANRFEGHLDDGRLRIGDATLDAPEHRGAGLVPAAALVRPHDLDVVSAAQPAIARATVRHIVRLGPVVRLQLRDDASGEALEAELPAARAEWLALEPGQSVRLGARHVKVFRTA